MWLTNLYNFMDGIDGLAGVQALLASLALALVATRAGGATSAWLLLALAGASAGFLFFNFPPSSIFMGDVGSTAIGFFFGVLPLLPGTSPVAIEPVAISLSLFVLDATVTLLRRMAAGEKWYTPHRSHLYQRPVVLGVAHRSVLLVGMCAMAAVAWAAQDWPQAAGGERVLLVVLPVAIYAAGHVLLERMTLRTRPTE